MAQNYERYEKWKCSSCGEEHEDEQDAIDCCSPYYEEGFRCEVCNTEYEIDEEEDAEKCCKDEVLDLIDEVEKLRDERNKS